MGWRLRFLGAAGCVTGSKYLLESAGESYLVDCGLFQGAKTLRLQNWDPPAFPPERLRAVVVTHAHLDHTGWLPRLVRQGFGGPIYSTPATADLAALLLPDSARLQEEDAAYANKKGFSKHKPALPLYTEEDARAALALFRTVPYETEVRLSPRVTFRFLPTGHLLGAAFAELTAGPYRIVFSGDLGRRGDPFMRAPAGIDLDADAILMESTYGVDTHPPDRPDAKLADCVNRAVGRGGTVLIPAFAVGRTALLLFHLRNLQEAGRIPTLPIWVDSPMAVDATKVYCAYPEEHNLKVSLDPPGPQSCALAPPNVGFSRTVEESKRLNRLEGPAIILSSSGMAVAGRILHHLKRLLPDPKNIVLLPGFQAAGTRGRALEEGAPAVKIHGEKVPVRAEVVKLREFSAHGDVGDLTAWLRTAPARRRTLHLVHGEPDEMAALRDRLAGELGWDVRVPALGEAVELSG